ncbi:hypothetical protein Bbelb_204120 [Branchiostoma belcheri]|nr:hypothetical protein Bbelb_204120 [Branchiostoma belcheri]
MVSVAVSALLREKSIWCRRDQFSGAWKTEEPCASFRPKPSRTHRFRVCSAFLASPAPNPVDKPETVGISQPGPSPKREEERDNVLPPESPSVRKPPPNAATNAPTKHLFTQSTRQARLYGVRMDPRFKIPRSQTPTVALVRLSPPTRSRAECLRVKSRSMREAQAR